ncbi:MAG TPA: TetR/AcrR family transcriptional regulator [Marmoricola sp.]|nr:TetR/AcrR family transcriptional regulator [Marmoricola sp.]
MTETVDGRRARGDATRRRVAGAAAQTATVHGLDSITVGGLAAETGVSKSGILTVFENREAIQIAAVAAARDLYIEHVVGPAWGSPSGKPRLRALVQHWADYLRAGVFRGGCFVSATTAEFGHRVGAVADAVRNLEREWLDVLEAEFAAAGSKDPIGDAFRLDAYLRAANVRRELLGEDDMLERAEKLALTVIARPSR